MATSSHMCCIPIDISVRIIGCLYLLGSCVEFALLTSNYPAQVHDDTISRILGIDSDALLRCMQPEREYNQQHNHLTDHAYLSTTQAEELCLWLPPLYLVFTLFGAISGTFLIWASVTKQRWMTTPWLVYIAIHGGLQVATFVVYITDEVFNNHHLLLLVYLLHIFSTLYSLGTVVAAYYVWTTDYTNIKSLNLSCYSIQETWENMFRSPPRIESPYNQHV